MHYIQLEERGLRKVSVIRMLIFQFLIALSSNIVHPVEPALIKNLNLPDYTFGVIFAAMSLTYLLVSPYFGRLSDRKGRVGILGISLIGYSLSQLGFGLSQSLESMFIYRFIAGIFVGGESVSCLSYVIDLTDTENRSKYMSYYAALTSIGTSIGYLLGGAVGDYSILGAFIVQVAFLFILGISAYLFLGESLRTASGHRNTAGANMGLSKLRLADLKQVLTFATLIFMIAAMFTSFSTNAYDNAFNYYIRSELNFPPSYNGIIKAVTGVIGLVINFTINIWILRRTNERKAIVGVLSLTCASLLLVLFTGSETSFIIANIIFYGFNAMYIPIEQSLAAKDREGGYGFIMGIFNSAKGIGMITGSLFAGFIYVFGSKLPFVYGALGFFIAAVLYGFNYLQRKDKTSPGF